MLLLCFIIIIIHHHLLETTLNPPPPILEVCPGDKNTLSCTEDGTAYIIWNWNGTIMKDYTAGHGINFSINTTDPLLNNNNMMVHNKIQILNTMNGFGQRKVQVICKHVPIMR